MRLQLGPRLALKTSFGIRHLKVSNSKRSQVEKPPRLEALLRLLFLAHCRLQVLVGFCEVICMLARLFSSTPYLAAGDEEVRGDSLRMQALLLAEGVAVVVGENPAASGRLLDDAAPQGVGVVVIGEVEHVEVSELHLYFWPCASLSFSAPSGNQRLQRWLSHLPDGHPVFLEELFPVQLFPERLLEATAVSEKAFMRLGWFTGIVGIGGSSNSADVICDLEKPARIRVCIAVIRNVFCEYII